MKENEEQRVTPESPQTKKEWIKLELTVLDAERTEGGIAVGGIEKGVYTKLS